MAKKARIRWNGPKIRQAQRAAAARGLRRAAEHILAVSQDQVPVEDKDLQRSGKVSVDSGQLRAAVSYGGKGITQAYALHQHEDLTLRHDQGGKAKYLEDPMRSETREVRRIIAANVRKGLE